MPLVVTARELRPLLESMQAVQGPGLLAANLIVQINRYEERLPVLRRHLRRLETVVPFAAPHIVIRSLGKIEVRVNNRLVTVQDWTSPVARDLFFYLLAHPDGVTKEQAGVIFWPEATPADLKLRFKNSMYRLRHAIGKDVIEFENDYYRFNRNLDFEFDVESFLKELAEAEQEAETRPKMAHLRSALRFYRGTYMPLVEGTWFLVERERLHQIYIEALLSYTNLQLETMQYEAALTSCQQALNEDPYLEAAHRLAMRAHAALGNNAAVVRQYELCSQKLLNDIGTTPSPQTQALYEALLQ
jgi:LuxR family maltose regulon positive regulatory protein